MKNFSFVITAAVLGLLPLSALAHHSFAAEYDGSQPIAISGTVSKVEWKNPHIWFYVDVKDASGKVATWGFSGGAPGMLMRRGIRPEVLTLGDTIKVEGFRARDGSNNASGGKVTFADGRSVFTASAEDAVPK
jgi:Family of unknown function (DUF6152)